MSVRIITRVSAFMALVWTILALASPAQAAWPSDPSVNLPICDRTGEQTIPLVAATSDGGCYVAWFDKASGNYDVYLQRLSPDGTEQWPHNGLLVSNHPQDSWLTDWDLIVDQDDCAVVVFNDIRTASNWDVYAYRIGQDGQFLWGPDGIGLSNDSGGAMQPRAALASDGDVAVVWTYSPDMGDGAIYMQRLAPDGTLRYAAGGIVAASGAGESPAFPDIAAADDGAVIVSWVKDISSYFSDRHWRAAKFAPDGSPLWGPPVSVFDAVPLPLGYAPRIQPDGAGGAVFCWHRASGTMYNSLVQRLDSSGLEVFPHNGVVVSTLTSNHHLAPTCSYHPATEEILVFWLEENSNQSQYGVYGQKFSSAGARQWGDTGKVLMPVNGIFKMALRSLPYGDGAMVFLIDEPTGMYGQNRVIGMRVDGNGNQIWAGSPIEVSSLLSGKSRLPVAMDGAGVVKLVWEDDRSGNIDIYGQNVNPDGTLGASSAGVPGFPIGISALGQNQPNPFTAWTRIPFESGEAIGRISIYDCAGRCVRVLEAPSERSGGVDWDGRDDGGQLLPAGCYFYRPDSAASSREILKAILLR